MMSLEEFREVIIARLETKLLRAKWLIRVLVTVVGLSFFIIYVQAENNKQLIYDLNVSQTALMIQKANYKRLESQIAKGLCLEPLELK